MMAMIQHGAAPPAAAAMSFSCRLALAGTQKLTLPP
jgi:hypothetical protein